jgi:hypothetical protein
MEELQPIEEPQAAPEPAEELLPPGGMRVLRGVTPQAWKVLIYGKPGVGKSSLGARAPKPLFLDLEGGLSRIDCAKTPKKLTTIEEVRDWLRYVIRSREYQTVVIDTVDEIDKMLSDSVIATWNKTHTKVKALSDIPYGRGGDLLVAEWREFIENLAAVTSFGKNVLLIGHEQVVKFENPTGANYDFYTVNVHKKAAPILVAKLDAVLFTQFDTFVKNAEEDKGKAVATGRRILLTNDGSSWEAKNRFGLPNVINNDDFTFDAFN